MRKYIGLILLGVIIAVLIVMNLRQRSVHNSQVSELLTRLDIINQVISKKDSTLFHYSKMVDNFDITEKDLRRQLKKVNDEFASALREAEERILSLHEYNILIKSQKDTIMITEVEILDDVLFFEIEDYYPDAKNPFVTYKGTLQIPINESVDDPVIAREFVFSPIKINMAMTETAKGAWKYHILNSPSWLDVGKISIVSLPAEEYKPDRGVKFSVGGGVQKNYQGRAYIMLGAGGEYKGYQAILSGGLNGVQLMVMRKLKKD